ncbi:MAG TPA: heavy metal-binding domain-containing protein [Candidatus Omnitrophota bacterium]|nr:heavy metal-binding domain-containing protein [Candidatus Omnitrophota bacterium]
MKKIILLLIVLAVVAVGFYKWNDLRILFGATDISHQSDVHSEQYQCPMHPQVIQDHPGNCPICGMRLVKTESKSEVAPGGTLPASDVPGHVTVHLTDEKIRSIGVVTETVNEEPLKLPLRLTGRVFYNPQILDLLYRYREAAQVQIRYSKPTAELIAESRAVTWTLRTQLRRLGVSEDVFKKIEESLKDPTSFVPANVFFEASGAYIDARLPVSDLSHAHVGQPAQIYSPMAPEKKLEGVLRSLDSVVDAASQTLAVRFEVVSGYELLKPGMFVTVEMELDLGVSLSIPSSALFNPGKRAYVFVENEPGVFVPQMIQMGVMAGERVQVLEGLKTGDKVVTAANFLLDSESRFQAARGNAAAGGHSHD